ncbi:MAG: protein kinase [Nitrospirae bacterium]|nr:protein kinase [Nitrospirota bacterium]
MDLPAHFGKYFLVHQLGMGGMAELFLAKQSGLKGFEKILAIKKILPHLTQDPEFVSMFVNEAKLAALLTHQHIVQIFDLGHVDGAYYIAMEYVMGKDVRSLVGKIRAQNGRLPVEPALLIVSQVASGLDYAHRKKDLNGRDLNIVHRDVSPQNILVSYEGEVKLVDFGIAKAAGTGQETRTGILKGKLAYMSPEQAGGRMIDRRSDVFSLGIVLYELLTARRLFKGDSDLSTLEQVRTAQIEPPRRFDANIPEALEAVVLKALAREPEHRYQTASDFQAALERVMTDRGQGFSSLHLAQYLGTVFADELRVDAERFQSAHHETVRTEAKRLRPTVLPGRRSEPSRPVTAKAPTRPAPPAPRHGFRTAALGAVMLFLLGSLTVVSTPSALSWMRTQSPEVSRLGQLIEEGLEGVGLYGLVPAPLSAALSRVPSPPVGNRPADVEHDAPRPAPLVVSTPELPAAPSSDDAIETPPISSEPPAGVGASSAQIAPAETHRSPPGNDEGRQLLRRAKTLYAEGRLDEVEDVLRTAIEREPNSPLAYHLLGTVYLERKDEERALKVFSEASHQFPNHAALHYDLGFLYAQRGLGTLAREELAKAVGLQPEGGLASRARQFLRIGIAGRPSGQPPAAPAPLAPSGEPVLKATDVRAVSRAPDGPHQSDIGSQQKEQP